MNFIEYAYTVLLPAAVIAMWVWFKKRADDCDIDRRLLWKAISRLSGVVHAVRSCPATHCPLREEAHEAIRDMDNDLDPDGAKQRTLQDLGIKETPPTYSTPQQQA